MVYAESIQENEMQTLLWNLEIQTNLQISTRRPDLVIGNKTKKRFYRIVDFAVQAHREVKLKENEMKD